MRHDRLQTVVLVTRYMSSRLATTRDRHALGALTADAAGDLDVLGLDGDPLGMDGFQVAVLKEMDEVRLGRLLQRDDGLRLPWHFLPGLHESGVASVC